MKTASFHTYTGAGRISIARWAPRGTPAGYRVFKALAPSKEMMGMSAEEFGIVPRLPAASARCPPGLGSAARARRFA